MKITFGKRIQSNLDLVLLFAFCYILFYYLINNIATDITVHIEQIKRINSNRASYPANFLFYFLINLLSGFSNGILLNFATSFLLAAACVGKYLISKMMIGSLNLNNNSGFFANKTHSLTIVVLALFFCFAIPDPLSVFIFKKMYLGKFVPMVWHNSTTILLFPFAILLYWKQQRLFINTNKATVKEICILCVLVLINILIKPSFIFTYIPVTLFFLLNKKIYADFSSFILKLTPLFFGVLAISLQYYLIFIKQEGSFYNESSKIILSFPFELMSNYIPIWYIPLSFIFSYALIIFVVFFYREILKDSSFQYALALTIFGIFISAIFIETGPRALHGNLLWQNVICTYLLFLSTVAFLIQKLMNKKLWQLTDKVAIGLFTLHALSGILYLVKIVVTTSYY